MGDAPTADPFRYNCDTEMDRMLAAGGGGAGKWKVSSVNRGYRVCPSYSERVIIPGRLDDELLRNHARFRSKHRFPTVVWIHPTNGACLARCSQPEAGVKGKAVEVANNLAGKVAGMFGREHGRCESPRMDTFGDDEGDKYIIDFFAAERRPDECAGPRGPSAASPRTRHSVNLTIADARRRDAAEANRLRGGGTEGAAFGDCAQHFLNIGNIHTMRDAVNDFRKALAGPTGGPGTAGWTRYAEKLGTSGCDGWDRTSQLVSLSALLLDPYYGHECATWQCHDWLQTGHKFADRNGLHEEGSRKRDQESPMFLQFLECVAHITQWRPRAFEYGKRDLDAVVPDHVAPVRSSHLHDALPRTPHFLADVLTE
eukprot:gene27894-49640_t